MTMNTVIVALLVATSVAVSAPARACDLEVTAGWVRAAPPGAMMLAGYAEIVNRGKSTRRVASLSATGFAAVEMHETVVDNGIARMRPLGPLELGAGEQVRFAPGGRHFMLVRPAAVPRAGTQVTITLVDDAGCRTYVPFRVLATAPTAPATPADPGAPTGHSHH